VLGVTLRYLHDLGTNLDELATRLLPTAPAVVAYGQSHLVGGPSFVGWASENLAREKQQRRIIVERSAGIAPKLSHRLTESCVSFRRNLEA
jgi:hypothetical protein